MTHTPSIDPPRRLTLRSAEDVLALVPTVLGFHPQESLVMLSVGGCAVHARADLVPADQCADVLTPMLESAHNNGVTAVVLVAYSGDAEAAEEAVGWLAEMLDVLGIGVVGALRADGLRWYRAGVGEQGPVGGEEGTPYDIDGHPFLVQAVYDGAVTHGTRQELADSLVGTDPRRVEAVAEALVQLRDQPPPAVSQVPWLLATVDEELHRGVDRVRPPHALPVERVARLVWATTDARTYEPLLVRLDRAVAGRYVDWWRDIVRSTPAEDLAGPASVLGLCAWVRGDGALAWCAVDRALLADPDHVLAGLVAQLLESAVNPDGWDTLRHQLLEDRIA